MQNLNNRPSCLPIELRKMTCQNFKKNTLFLISYYLSRSNLTTAIFITNINDVNILHIPFLFSTTYPIHDHITSLLHAKTKQPTSTPLSLLNITWSCDVSAIRVGIGGPRTNTSSQQDNIKMGKADRPLREKWIELS